MFEIDCSVLKQAEADLQDLASKIQNLKIEDLFSFTQDYVDEEVTS